MHRLLAMQPKFMGRMLVNAKCAPHYQRVLWEHDPASPFLKGFVGAGGCPARRSSICARPARAGAGSMSEHMKPARTAMARVDGLKAQPPKPLTEKKVSRMGRAEQFKSDRIQGSR